MTDSRNKRLLSHASASPDKRRRWVVFAALLTIVATGAVFAPAVHYEFINYDDDWFVSDNPYVLRGLTASSIEYAFTTRDLGYPKPLTILSWMLDAQLYGGEAWGFHLTNVLLHALASGLLFLVLYVSTGSVVRSLLVVGLWAVHPLRVEPVAWVTSRKDVLAAVFGFGAWLAYVKAARDEKRGWYAGSLLLYACCLLSKPVFVTLPVLLLLWDYWPLKRLPTQLKPWRAWRGVLVEKAPYAALAAGLAVWVLLTRPESQHTPAPLTDRLANAAVSYTRYLGKLVDFSSLAIPYPHRDWSPLVWGAAAVLLAIVTAFAIWRRKRMPWLLVGWAWFLFAMAPMLRIKSFGNFSMADRFAYVPAIGVTLAVVWMLPTPRRKPTRIAATVGALAVVGALAGFSRVQLQHWHNSGTLFHHALAVTQDHPHPVAIKNLGAWYWTRRNLPADLGREARQRAMAFYEQALEHDPDLVPVLARYARLLHRDGREQRATAMLDHAVRVVENQGPDPGTLPDLNKLGEALYALGDLQRAERVYTMGLKRADDTRNPGALAALADGLANLGRIEEARRLSRRALDSQPTNPDLLNNYANVETKAGNHAAAADLYRRALAIFPDEPTYHFNFGRARRMAGDLRTARDHLRQALVLRPYWAEAHFELGATEQALGHLDRARQHYLAVIELKGRAADASNKLGVLAAQRNEYAKAEQWLQRALQIESDHSSAKQNLAILEQMRSQTP